ncbi:MAG: MBL fold metallo-hydrolase [Planctomycetota bacterium]|jgi:7,8-dihydropterin-6-yl-methyl-4-(beta-D-ribofuranosyl)aminobenzene 5'-phosphate synthase
MNGQTEAVSTDGVKNLAITITYDNNPCKQELETGWGFSACITSAEKTILFDTGSGGSMLDNMEKLAIEPDSLDIIFLSHIHGDHTGGLSRFLEKNSGVTIYLPEAFPKKFKDNVRDCGAKIVEVREPLKICENVYSTGQLGKLFKEQALIVRTDNGLVIIAGCAHPGILKIVRAVKDLLKDDILLVMGGFHLEWATKGKIEKYISAFKQWQVQYVGPCHCSGEKARTLFEKHFSKHYINIGAGKEITMAGLQ